MKTKLKKLKKPFGYDIVTTDYFNVDTLYGSQKPKPKNRKTTKRTSKMKFRYARLCATCGTVLESNVLK